MDDSLHGSVSGEVPESTQRGSADVAAHEVASSLAVTTDEMSAGALIYLPGRSHHLQTNGTLKLLVQAG